MWYQDDVNEWKSPSECTIDDNMNKYVISLCVLAQKVDIKQLNTEDHDM